MNRPNILHRHAPAAVTADTSDTSTLGDPRNERIVDASTLPQHSNSAGLDTATRTDDLTPPRPAVTAQTASARVSAGAVLGLVISVAGLCATLTGLLAPEGFAIGVIGVLVSVAGYNGAGRARVAGRGVATLGVLFGLAAIVLAVVAMTGAFSWPNSSTDQISHWHTWLVAHWAWLGHWS